MENTQANIDHEEKLLNRTLTHREQLDFAKEQYQKLAQIGIISLEEELLDLAIVLGFYGAMPTAACSGHEHSDDSPKEVIFPWVRFQAPKTSARAQKRLEHAVKEMEELSDDLSEAELNEFYTRFRAIWHKARDPYLKVCRHLLEVLGDFYRVHQAPTYGIQLTIKDFDAETAVLQSIGHDIYSVLPRREQLRLLKQSQAEMREFGHYLQERFLAADSGRPGASKYVVRGSFEL